MNQIIKDNRELFYHIPHMLHAAKSMQLFAFVMQTIHASNPADIIMRQYEVNGQKWMVFHGPTFKMTMSADHSYNCFFSKLDGVNLRFGKTVAENPEVCELGPEILDLEVSVNGCVPVKGSDNCKYCYKCNTNAPATNMTFDMFKDIVKRFPINLSQIAFGITGLQTNPDLPKMFECCRQIGIIPNLTTVGADMNDETKDMICKNAGACAVSCYPGAKELCYKTIKELHDYAKEKHSRDLHVNMHILLSKFTKYHLFEVLQDIADKKVEGLRAVVLLRVKPCGRAKSMDCVVPLSLYEEVIKFCNEHDINFGFDSCSATSVMTVLKKLGEGDLCSSCEPCESSRLSSYINVKGEYWSCSFAEKTDFIKPINVLDYESVTEWWNGAELKRIRENKNPACKSCPIYDLDGDAEND